MNWSKTKAEPNSRAQKPCARLRPWGWTKLIVVFASIAPTPVLATSLTYIESFPVSASPETLVHLIDQDETTDWCTENRGSPTRLRFHFKTDQAITRVRIQLARHPKNPLPVKLITASQVLSVDMRQRQLRVDLVKSLESSYADIMVAGQLGPHCITEIELSATTKNLTQLSHKPDVIKSRLALAGTWKRGALGSPTTFWTFSLDGSWTWTERSPLLARTKRLRGTWTVSREQLILKMPNQRKPLRLSLARRDVIIDEWAEDAPDKDYQELTFDSGSQSVLNGSYHNASFEMLH